MRCSGPTPRTVRKPEPFRLLSGRRTPVSHKPSAPGEIGVEPARRAVAVPLDFIGFTVGDVFGVGYGIDHAEPYHHRPYLGRSARSAG